MVLLARRGERLLVGRAGARWAAHVRAVHQRADGVTEGIRTPDIRDHNAAL